MCILDVRHRCFEFHWNLDRTSYNFERKSRVSIFMRIVLSCTWHISKFDIVVRVHAFVCTLYRMYVNLQRNNDNQQQEWNESWPTCYRALYLNNIILNIHEMRIFWIIYQLNFETNCGAKGRNGFEIIVLTRLRKLLENDFPLNQFQSIICWDLLIWFKQLERIWIE